MARSRTFTPSSSAQATAAETTSPARQPTAAQAAAAASHPRGVAQSSPARLWKTSNAIEVSASESAQLNSSLIPVWRRHATNATAEPTSRPTSMADGAAKNSATTMTSSLRDTDCASRRTCRCRTTTSHAPAISAIAHHGSQSCASGGLLQVGPMAQTAPATASSPTLMTSAGCSDGTRARRRAEAADVIPTRPSPTRRRSTCGCPSRRPSRCGCPSRLRSRCGSPSRSTRTCRTRACPST